MNIIKRIGVALNIAIFDTLTENQAKQVVSEIQSEWWTKCPKQVDPHALQELQRRSERLAYIEGCGYELKNTDPKVAWQSSIKSTQVTFNPALAVLNNQQNTQAICAPVKEPRPINRNNRRGSVQDAVLRCIDRLQSRYYTSLDVWREYQLSNEPKTTRGTVLACVTHLRESGIIQAANPPRKLGSKIVHQK